MTAASEIDERIAQLGHYRTRAAARRQLAAMGTAAADRLLSVLRDPKAVPNARWSAITLLGQCRYEPAAAALLEILQQDPQLRSEAARALQQITGKDIGENAAEWTAALGGGTGAPVPPTDATAGQTGADTAVTGSAEMRLFKAALGDVVRELSWEDGYLYLRIPLGEQRKQQLIVTFDEIDANGNPMATFYTECGAASSQAEEVVSRRNVTMAHGRFLVDRDETGGRKIVMRCVTPVARLTPDLVREIALSMARDADAVEFELTQSDHI